MGCGSSFSCSKSKCSADPAPSQSEIDSCNAAINDSTCGSQFKSYAECYADHQVCASDNTTDITATDNAISSSCVNQYNDMVSCCTNNPSASACQ